jgi:hypothetical protein
MKTRRLRGEQLRRIDEWYAQPGRFKKPPAKVIAYELGVSRCTVLYAARRKFAYAALGVGDTV